LAGAQRDGHDFLPAAAAAGAAAALVSRPRPGAGLAQLVVGDTLRAWQAIAREHRRRFAGPVVGISGSAGKTSTKDLLVLLLGAAARGVAATEGNFNNELGVPLTLSRLDPARDRLAVIEAGISLPGEMDRLAAMIELWWLEAQKHGVLPLDDRTIELFGARFRPNSPHPVDQHYVYRPPMSPLPLLWRRPPRLSQCLDLLCPPHWEPTAPPHLWGSSSLLD
jgi:hypothetical protein